METGRNVYLRVRGERVSRRCSNAHYNMRLIAVCGQALENHMTFMVIMLHCAILTEDRAIGIALQRYKTASEELLHARCMAEIKNKFQNKISTEIRQ